MWIVACQRCWNFSLFLTNVKNVSACNDQCSADWPALRLSVRGKNFNVWIFSDNIHVTPAPGRACWLERRTRNRKVASSNSGTSDRRIFFSRVNFVCWLLIDVRFNLESPQWYVKDPGHSAKSADGRLHLKTHTSLTQRSRSGLTMPLYRRSVETYLETISHATCKGTSGHSRLSSLSHCGLIVA